MSQKFLGFIIVALVAIGVCLGVMGRQGQDPVLRQLLEQQNTILAMQSKLTSKMPDDADVNHKVQVLEQRVAVLEGQLKGLQMIFAQARNADNPAPAQQMPPPEDYTRIYEIPQAQSYVRGNQNAKVTIVSFTDFQCPFCARFHEPILEVLKAYPSDVKYVLKNFPLPFHPMARPAAKAALAAGEQGKYYEMADLLLKNGSALSEDKFKEIAKEIGLDVDKFMKDLKEKDAQWEKIIQDDMTLGNNVAVRGTPTYYINGRKTLARDVDNFKKEIDAILKGQEK